MTTPQQTDDQRRGNPITSRGWAATGLLAVAPLGLLGAVLWGIAVLKPLDRMRGEDFPPVEELTVVRTVLPEPGLIELHLVNGGPDPVTVAQVLVDEAYWSFWMDAGHGLTNDPALEELLPDDRAQELERRRTIGRLGRAVIWLEYPWVQGEAHEVVLISKTGVTFGTTIEVAVVSPTATARYFGLFALLGVLVGLIPVYLGLMWYPLIRRLGERTINVLLCFTVGLLVFLAIDAVSEALEASTQLPEVYQGPALIVLGVVGTMLLLLAAGGWMQEKATRRGPGFESLGLAYFIALGIGLHNLGEGLAIGAAFNLGALSLGTMLIVGFTLHNITEGLAIVSPLARVGVRVAHLGWLGLLAGGPTIVGGWVGAFAYSPLWSVLFLAIGAGAILQVVFEIFRQMAAGEAVTRVLRPLPNLGGLAAGFGLMYATSLLVAM